MAAPDTSATALRIAYIVHDFNWTWGHARYTAEIAKRLAREHEVHVFSNTADRRDSSGIHFHHVPAWRANALTTIFSFATAARFCVRGDFDIFHTQGFCGGPRNFVTAHMCLAAWNSARRKAALDLSWRERLFGLLVEGVEKRFYARAGDAQVIAVSSRTKNDLVHHYGCPGRIEVLHHGTDTEQFHPKLREQWREKIRSQHGIGDNDFVFLHLGDLRKGAAQAIEALKALPDVKLLLVARGNDETYRGLAAEWGVAGRAIFAGATDHPERYIGAADVLVCATPHDSFGLVMTEAMAAGLPVIASREAGASECIEDGRTGLILQDPFSVPEMIQSMKRLAGNPNEARAMGHEARSSIASRTWDFVTDRTLEMYRKALRDQKN